MAAAEGRERVEWVAALAITAHLLLLHPHTRTLLDLNNGKAGALTADT